MYTKSTYKVRIGSSHKSKLSEEELRAILSAQLGGYPGIEDWSVEKVELADINEELEGQR